MGATEPLINVDPEILGGTPVFAGTRVPVKTIVDYLAAGHDLEYFLDNYPSVSREQAVRFLHESEQALVERHGAPAA